MLTRFVGGVYDLLGRAWTRIVCGALHEHDDVRMFAPNRIYLKCMRCGRTTVGIKTGPAAPVIVPASFVNVDQVRTERRARVARLQARMRLKGARVRPWLVGRSASSSA